MNVTKHTQWGASGEKSPQQEVVSGEQRLSFVLRSPLAGVVALKAAQLQGLCAAGSFPYKSDFKSVTVCCQAFSKPQVNTTRLEPQSTAPAHSKLLKWSQEVLA